MANKPKPEDGPMSAPVACGCVAKSAPRKAVGVDPDLREGSLKRLRRIAGQVKGIQKMVESDRYCAEVMAQIASVQEALRGVHRNLFRNHLRHCASRAIIEGSPKERDAMYDELIDLVYKYGR